MSARVLVVDEQPVNRQLVCDILEFRGHRIAAAASVDEGREQLRLARPDIVLVDLQMPGEGGEVLLQEIRADESLRDLPVIAVTAFATEADSGRLVKAGFDGLVTKPIDTRAFGPTIESFLR